MSRSRLGIFTATVLLAAASLPAHAETASGTITGLGCHNTDDECFISVSGYTSSTHCNQSYQFRWNAGTNWGKRWYATFLAASLAGRGVSLVVHETACSAQGFPTFAYGYLEP
jgi:hypothetical protein